MKKNATSVALSPSMLKGFFAPSSPAAVQHGDFLSGGREGGAKSRCSGIKSVSPGAAIASCAVLYARKNSVYKKIAGCDVFDQAEAFSLVQLEIDLAAQSTFPSSGVTRSHSVSI